MAWAGTKTPWLRLRRPPPTRWSSAPRNGRSLSSSRQACAAVTLTWRPAPSSSYPRCRASGTELALGIAAAKGALLRDDDTAEELYREALERLGHTSIRVELARARLLCVD